VCHHNHHILKGEKKIEQWDYGILTWFGKNKAISEKIDNFHIIFLWLGNISSSNLGIEFWWRNHVCIINVLIEREVAASVFFWNNLLLKKYGDFKVLWTNSIKSPIIEHFIIPFHIYSGHVATLSVLNNSTLCV
jgi:hypothetical protein